MTCADGVLRWYCGTEKSGCYKSALSAESKKLSKKDSEGLVVETNSTIKPKPIRESTTKPTVTTKPKPAVTSEDIKAKVLSRIKKEKLVCLDMKLDENTITYDITYGFVVDKATSKVYGKLNEKKTTILGLEPEDMMVLDDLDIPIKSESESDGDSVTEKSEIQNDLQEDDDEGESVEESGSMELEEEDDE